MNLSRPHSVTTVHRKCLVLRDVMEHEELGAPQTFPCFMACFSPPSSCELLWLHLSGAGIARRPF